MQANQMFTTIDSHTGGEPLRIITGGIPPLKGKTILEQRAYFLQHLDHLRRVLMHEPRGHHGMYGCIITPPVSSDAHFGVLFMHNEGLSTMCGHGIIAVVTAAIETGFLLRANPAEPIVIDSPAGKIVATAKCDGIEVTSVSFENVRSFLFASNVPINLNDRQFTVDIAFGGAFYAIVEARELGLQVEIEQLPALRKWGRAIKEQIDARMAVQHPLEPELAGIYGVIFSAPPKNPGSHLRNVTIFADEQVDRSPCGTGTAARLSCLFQRKEWKLGESFVHEGILGTQFRGEITATSKVGPFEAILPRIEGRAFITGIHQFVVDPADPLSAGFLLA